MVACFHFALIFISVLKYYFQHVHHLIWKMIITVIIIIVLRAFVVEEVMPVSQRTRAFVGPVGFVGFSPGQLGRFAHHQTHGQNGHRLTFLFPGPGVKALGPKIE